MFTNVISSSTLIRSLHNKRIDVINKQQVGHWKDDKRNGKGTNYFANGQVKEGMWADDKLIG